ncbi:MAG: hypothetical protein HYW14_02675 [Planctomycetes bacterium]|nr:hypothetical protein [Planctomycetota bacterium]
MLTTFCIPNNLALAEYAANDIAVTKIGFEEQSVESGDAVFLTVTVEVENKGTVDAQDVPITVYVGKEIIAQDTIPYIPAGETFNLSYDWGISTKEIPYKSNIRAEVGFMEGRDEYIDKDTMSRNFTLTEKDGKIVPRYSVEVHRWITRQAVQFLKDRTNNQALKDELNNTIVHDGNGDLGPIEKSLANGAQDEDCPTFDDPLRVCPDFVWRWLRHFYRPTDGKGYKWLGTWKDSALVWALGGIKDTNSYNWYDAIKDYMSCDYGSYCDKGDAYYALGHVLHLIEDMSLPEHTHLECHADALILCGSGSYEAYVTNHIFTGTGEENPLPLLPSDIDRVLYDKIFEHSYYKDDLKHIPPNYLGDGNPLVEETDIVRYNTLKEYIVNLAKLSYYLNRHKADLSDTSKSGLSVGPLGLMFPGLIYCTVCDRFPTQCWNPALPLVCDTGSVRWLWLIPDLGYLDTGGWFNNGTWWKVADEPGNDYDSERNFYYIEDTQHAIPSYYKTYWDPDKTDGSNDKYEGYNSTGLPLARLYARDLIPLAIRYVAGAIDLFWRQTHPVFTSVQLSPNIADPGDTLTITCDIQNDANKSFDVLLGASIFKSSTNTGGIDLPSDNNEKINIPQLSHTAPSRDFTIPSSTPEGTYDLWVKLWKDENSNGEIDSGDTQLAFGKFLNKLTISSDGTKPNPPVLVSPGTHSAPGEEINTTTPTFKWNSVPGADSYGLYVSEYPYDELNIKYQKENIPGTDTSLTLPPEKALVNGVKYRWNMRACNSAGCSYQTNRLYFNVNLSSTNDNPNNPVSLEQYKFDGTTIISNGWTTNESTVVFKGTVSDPDNDQVKLQIELRPLNEGFTGVHTHESTLVSSGGRASITVASLANGSYHWKGRAVDTKGATSNWVDAGSSEPNADFFVSVSQTQNGCLSVVQSDGFTSSGNEGGPFYPSSKAYTLMNTGNSNINYTVSKNASWLNLSGSTSGSLSQGSSTDVTVSINDNAKNLSSGTHSDTISFTNTTNGCGSDSRSVNLIVNQVTTHTLTVASSNPNNGVQITILPNDRNGQNDGTTPFPRVYNDNTTVKLTAPSTAGSNKFQKWMQNGTEGGNNPITYVQMDKDYTMTAVYTPTKTLTVFINGRGTVKSSPAGIDCGFACSKKYDIGTQVTLTPTPDTDWIFSGWSGWNVDCDGTDDCTITMDSDKMVTATFECLPPCPGTCDWQTETVDSNGHVGRYTSLAYDSSGNPAISYYEDKSGDTNGNLRFARFNGTSWDIETVDYASWNVGGYTSLAFDSSGNPGISYFSDDLQTPNPSLRYAHFNGSSWDIETVDTGEVGKFTSLAFDASDNPAISYYDASPNALKYAHFNGSSWNITTVDSNVLYGNTSLAFDPSSGNPAIAYSGGKYAHFNGSSWDKTNVGTTGWDVSLAFDSSGNPGISYIGSWHLGYAHFNGSSWDITTVDPIFITGGYSSLAFDASDNPAISYLKTDNDFTNGDLRFAHFNGSSWDINTVDYAGDVGMYTSLAFDASDNPTISYYDETNVDLKFARCTKTQPPCPTYYRDADEDGYGNPYDSVQDCVQPAGYVLDYSDCNDNDPYTYDGCYLFFDGFNDSNIDSNKWIYGGNSVTEDDARMKVETTVKDQGGWLNSKLIEINDKNVLTITRRVKLHYANEYFSGEFKIYLDQVSDFSFGISYQNYQVDCPGFGFFVYRNGHLCSQQNDVSERIEPVWDRWFNEKIVYNPATGLLEYFIDGEKQVEFNVGTLPTMDSYKIGIAFGAGGWFTGHYQHFDNIAIAQDRDCIDEICDDGMDNDCDGLVDCDDDDCHVDNDNDGCYAQPCGNDCDDNDSSKCGTEICDDGKDNDCDGFVDCNDPDCQIDKDNDGCLAPPCGDDCDDNNYQKCGTEICDDSIDNDCDGQVDEGCCTDNDNDGYKAQPNCGTLVDCNDNDAKQHPNQKWYKDGDNDGYSDGTNITSCARPNGYKVQEELTAISGDCNDSNASIHPNATEVCNDGVDNDCDELIDCNDPDCRHPENCTNGVDDDCDNLVDCNDPDCQIDKDNDGCFAPPCGNDCDDNNSRRCPNFTENCSDGVDNDCDSLIDCLDDDCPPCPEEICYDGVDNDGDGLVDCSDPDCCDDPNCVSFGGCTDTKYFKGTSYLKFNYRKPSKDVAIMQVCVDKCFCEALKEGVEKITLWLDECNQISIPGRLIKSNGAKTMFWASSTTYKLTIDCKKGWFKLQLKNVNLKGCISPPFVKTCVSIANGLCLCAEDLFKEERDRTGRLMKLTLTVINACSP